MTKNILFFKHINKNDTSLVGGKGSNLGEMISAGLPVPNGFCVTTNAFKTFIQHNHLSVSISDILSLLNDHNAAQVAREVRQIILNGEIQNTLVQEVKDALKAFPDDVYFSIRSSATAEDLEFASFAGQQDTYLNIKGDEAVICHMKKCWASLYTKRAVLYRTQNEIDHHDVCMSVVIQQMIKSEKSGILFTADPVTGHRGTISIDAGFGLGEALVSGLVSPDIYKVNKTTNEIVDKVIPYKKLVIQPLADGGTKTIKLSKDEGSRQVLSDEMILRLSKIGVQIENHYQQPQDIEWCIENNEIYIVQSRAITSLYPIPAPSPADRYKHFYVSVSHMQSMLDEISPLGLDFLPLIFNTSKKPISDFQSTVLLSAGGRFYADLTRVLHIKGAPKKIIGALNQADALISRSIETLYAQGEFNQKIKVKKSNLWKLLWSLKSVPFRIFKLMFFKDPSKIVNIVDDNVKRITSEINEKIENQHNSKERLECIYSELTLVNQFIQYIIPYLATGILSLKVLEKISMKNFGDKKLIGTMTKGLKGNITTEMGLLLGDLADKVRDSKELSKEFYSDDFDTLFERIENLEGNKDFKRDFTAFMEKYGCRANGEIDIAKTRWHENPEQVVRSIRSIVEEMSHQQHRLEFANTEKEAQLACEEFIRLYAKKNGRLKTGFVKHLVKVMRNALPVREHHKFMLISIYRVVKLSLLKDARQLVEAGAIETETDIFWLRLSELYHVTNDPEACKTLIQSRKETWKHYATLKPPRVMTSEGEIIHAHYNSSEYPEGALIGIAASSGVYEGIARVITDPAKETLNKGEILVTTFTDPAWTPLFLNAAGLVMEIGGQLTHGTVVAREYGIPAVVGVEDAIKRIKTGDKIRIDGNSGYITVLESKG